MYKLTNHRKIVDKYILSMEKIESKYKVKKRDINKTILELSNTLTNVCETTNFPINYYDNIVKEKMKYDNILEEERIEKENLMKKYYDEMCEKKINNSRNTECKNHIVLNISETNTKNDIKNKL